MDSQNKIKSTKTMVGEVISDKMHKTIVVTVERTYKNAHVHKVMKTFKKYKVHDEQETAHVGDIVEFYEGRPVSKTKYMYLARIIKPHAAGK